MLTRFLFSTLLITFSSVCIGQVKNLLFSFCDVGDNISVIAKDIYCVDSKGFNRNIYNCRTRQFRYFPSRADSLLFPVIQFENILIIVDKEYYVQSIWLLQQYSSDSLDLKSSRFEADYYKLKNYLNKALSVLPEQTTENVVGGGKLTGLMWTTDNYIYHLKSSRVKNKNNQDVYQINVQIR